jgi:hypothetical protein
MKVVHAGPEVDPLRRQADRVPIEAASSAELSTFKVITSFRMLMQHAHMMGVGGLRGRSSAKKWAVSAAGDEVASATRPGVQFALGRETRAGVGCGVPREDPSA